MTEAELAQRSGVTVERIRRLVDLGILAPSNTELPFAEADVRRVRLAEACASAGLALEAIGSAIASGRLSLSFLDHPAYGGWSAHADRTFAELAGAIGVSAEVLIAMREALGFERPAPEDSIREDELHVVPTVRMGLESGLDPEVIMRMLRVYGEALTRIAEAEAVIYRRHMRSPLRRAGERPGEVIIAAEAGGRFVPLVEEALLAIYHRQQERVWLQNLIEGIQDALEEEGLAISVERPPAICFLDLTGYTAITEDQGDEAAAHLVARVGDVVQEGAVRRGGRVVKWLGDGVMLFFPEPAHGVRAGLQAVDDLDAGGLPAAHVGIDAGPVVQQDGDYFGRTVNLAARVATQAGPGEVLVTSAVVDAVRAEPGIRFEEAASFQPKGISDHVILYRAKARGDDPLPRP